MNVRLSVLLISILSLTSCLGLQTRNDVSEQSTQVAALKKERADQDSRITDMQQDMKVFAGRLEALEHNQGQGQEGQKQQLENLKKQMDANTERIKLVEQHMEAMETRIMAALNKEAAANEPVPEPGSAKGEDHWAVGEKQFANKEWKAAIVAFNKYREKNPKGKNLAEATYKIGVCFSEMGMKKEAKTFYEQTLSDFPGSPAARKAKYRLSNLK